MAEIVVIHGAPGAGKSSLCGLIDGKIFDNYSVRHFPIGDLLRSIRNGELVSDFSGAASPSNETANGIMFEAVDRAKSFGGYLLALFDGYPRKANAVEGFYDEIKARGDTFAGAVVLQADRDVVLERIVQRGLRKGEISLEHDLMHFAVKRYEKDMQYLGDTIERLAELAPVVTVDTNRPLDVTYPDFRKAVQFILKPVFSLEQQQAGREQETPIPADCHPCEAWDPVIETIYSLPTLISLVADFILSKFLGKE